MCGQSLSHPKFLKFCPSLKPTLMLFIWVFLQILSARLCVDKFAKWYRLHTALFPWELFCRFGLQRCPCCDNPLRHLRRPRQSYRCLRLAFPLGSGCSNHPQTAFGEIPSVYEGGGNFFAIFARLLLLCLSLLSYFWGLISIYFGSFYRIFSFNIFIYCIFRSIT